MHSAVSSAASSGLAGLIVVIPTQPRVAMIREGRDPYFFTPSCPSKPHCPSRTPKPARVALLVTCLVDLFRPSVGFAAVALLEAAGCTVEVPRAQTCCGQPAYNSGDRADAKAIARQVIETFAEYDYVVAPSGSCAGMLRVHYPELFADEPAMRSQAEELAARTYELVSFLVDVRGMNGVAARWDEAARLTTTAVPACASSASRRSRAACSPRLRGCA